MMEGKEKAGSHPDEHHNGIQWQAAASNANQPNGASRELSRAG